MEGNGDLKCKKHGRMVAALKMKGSIWKNAGKTPGGQASHRTQCQRGILVLGGVRSKEDVNIITGGHHTSSLCFKIQYIGGLPWWSGG